MAPIRNPTRNIQNLLILIFFFACSDFGVKNGKKKKGKNFVLSVSKFGPHHPRPYQKFSRPAKDVLTFRGQAFENTSSFHLI